MMYQILAELEKEVGPCRNRAQLDESSPCHKVTQYRCHENRASVQLIVPHAESLGCPVEVVTVGINPKWSLPLNAPASEDRRRRDTGSVFHGYKDDILREVRVELQLAGTRDAHLELVQCGTPGGFDVLDVISICREKFFDKAIATLRPKVVIPIGRFASEHLYWHKTYAGRSGEEWIGMKQRHATYEIGLFGDHECSIVFVMQPRGVSKTGRESAARIILERYIAHTRTKI